MVTTEIDDKKVKITLNHIKDASKDMKRPFRVLPRLVKSPYKTKKLGIMQNLRLSLGIMKSSLLKSLPCGCKKVYL